MLHFILIYAHMGFPLPFFRQESMILNYTFSNGELQYTAFQYFRFISSHLQIMVNVRFLLWAFIGFTSHFLHPC